MANYIPEDKVSEIKNSADIVEVISEVVLLKRAGKNYLGLCPFHSEKDPSFTVSPEKQIFYCFGCTAGGNVFSFLMKYQNISFPDAARMLSRRYGIEIPMKKMSPHQKMQISQRESLLDINKKAMDFFRQGLFDNPLGKQALEYLKNRGIKEEIINNFYLGYALEGWDNIVHFFSKKNIPLSLVEKAGLIVSKKNKDGFYDRFRGRIIFPIFDTNMQVVGFGGRVMDDSMPKYLNSPETPIYNKRRSLYGMHKAKIKCRESDSVYIVEGYFDLLSLHQHGIEDAVAILGTALTTQHIQLLKGYASRVVLVYDSDDAGLKAASRSVEIFMDAEVDARILILPEGFDPDSYLFEFGLESFLDASGNALSVMQFLINSAIKKHGLSIEGKIRVISEMKGPLASIHDKVARSLYIKEFAERLNINETTILEKVREISSRNLGKATNTKWSNSRIALGPRKSDKKIQKQTIQAKGVRLERQIIEMMLQYPKIFSEIENRNILVHFNDISLKYIGQMILSHMKSPNKQVSDIMNLFEDKEQRDMVASLAIGEDRWDYESCVGIIDRFESTRNQAEKELVKKIRMAEKNDDFKLLEELLSKRQKMAVLKEKKKMSLLK